MRKRINRRLPPLPVPPEGFMYEPGAGGGLVPIDEVANLRNLFMDAFDNSHKGSCHYYKNDPSYWWGRK